MGKKKWILVFTAFLFIFGLSDAQASFRWRHLGRAPLMPRAVEDVISLQESFYLYKEEIIKGLQIAESLEINEARKIFESLDSLIRSGKVEEIFLPPGQKFIWMVFKHRQGRIGVVKNVVWSGNKSLLGFLFLLNYQGKALKFFIAAKCGNLALISRKREPEQKKLKNQKKATVAIVVIQPLPLLQPAQKWRARVWWNPRSECCGYGGPNYYSGYYSHYYSRRSTVRIRRPRVRTRPPGIRSPGVITH